MSERIKISEMAFGALQEQFDIELNKVLENIADPNTDPKKARKIQINIKVIPNSASGLAHMEFQTKTTLVPADAVGTEIVFEKDADGDIAVSEFAKGTIPGQVSVDEIQVDQETGEIIEDKIVRRIGGAM